MTGDRNQDADLGWRLTDEAAIAAIVDGRHGDPFSILGPHMTPRGLAIRTLRPGADTAEAIDPAGKRLATLLRRHGAGFFEGLVDPRLGLFESSSSVADGADGGADGSGDSGGGGWRRGVPPQVSRGAGGGRTSGGSRPWGGRW